jgi:adenylate kinase
MRVIIGGIPGVGKTTVLNALTSKGFRVENYGDSMLRVAVSLNYAANRDELRKLPLWKQKEVQKLAAESLSKFESVIVDTHFCVQTDGGYLPGLPPYVLEILKPDLFISIEADPLEIFERRKKDTNRRRDNDSLEKIRQHMEVNRGYGINYSAMTGSPFLIVMNENDRVTEATLKIEAVLKPSTGDK